MGRVSTSWTKETRPQTPGASKKEVDFEVLDKLCALQCTLKEIADYFEIDHDTVAARIREKFGMTFTEYFETKRSRGKISLRRAQFQKAEAGDTTMQIWLGKQYLDQSDKREVRSEVTGKDGGPIEVVHTARAELIRRLRIDVEALNECLPDADANGDVYDAEFVDSDNVDEAGTVSGDYKGGNSGKGCSVGGHDTGEASGEGVRGD